MIKFNNYYNKVNTKIAQRTAKRISFLIPAADLLNDPKNFIEKKLTIRQRKVLNCLIYLSNAYNTVYVSQDKLASYSGLTRIHVNRVLLTLINLGLVSSSYRHLQTCLYSVTSWFQDFWVRKRLQLLLPALKILPISFLMTASIIAEKVASGEDFRANVTQYNTEYLNSSKQLAVYNYDYKEGVFLKDSLKKSSKDSQEGEGVMKKYDIIVDMEYELGLDADAVCKLEKYSLGVLAAAKKKLLEKSNVSNRAGYFMTLCENIHREGTQLTNKVSSTIKRRGDSESTSLKKKDLPFRVLDLERKQKISESWQDMDSNKLQQIKEDYLKNFKGSPFLANYMLGLLDVAYKNSKEYAAEIKELQEKGRV